MNIVVWNEYLSIESFPFSVTSRFDAGVKTPTEPLIELVRLLYSKNRLDFSTDYEPCIYTWMKRAYVYIVDLAYRKCRIIFGNPFG